MAAAAPKISDDGVVNAIEEASADDKFYDVSSGQTQQNQQHAPLGLSEEERQQLEIELAKTEDEINTLRQVLAARMKHSTELKRKLGITVWAEIQQDVSQSVRTVRESAPVQRTTEVIHDAGDTMRQKFQQMRNSAMFKSVEGKVGTGLGWVKSKVVVSKSSENLASVYEEDQARGVSQTVPTTPADENKGMK